MSEDDIRSLHDSADERSPAARRPRRSDPHQPPASAEIEASVIGAIISEPTAYEEIADVLFQHHFYVPMHGRIYFEIGRRLSSGLGQLDIVGLQEWAKRDDTMIQAASDRGSAPGEIVLSLARDTPLLADQVPDAARQIVALWKRRRIIEIGRTLVDGAYKVNDAPVEDLLGHHEAALIEMDTGGGVGDEGPKPIGHYARLGVEAIERRISGEAGAGIPTGIVDFDKKHGPLFPSDLIVIASRPSIGKTSLLWQFMCAAERHEPDKVPYLASIEMTGELLALREISYRSDYEVAALRSADLTPEQFTDVRRLVAQIENSRIHVDDRAALTVATIRNGARRIQRQHGLSMVGIDYLQLMQGDHGGGRRQEYNRVQEISAITRGIKMMAKDLDVPVVLLSQLSRAVEARDDKRPMLQDLRDSGSIEQDADSVVFIYRESYYLAQSEPRRKADESDEKFDGRHAKWEGAMAAARNKAELIIGKARHGAGGTVSVAFFHNRGFFDLAR